MFHQIDSLADLQQEREKLEREATVARQYLDIKVKQTWHNGKQTLKSKASWPVITSAILAFGVQQLNSTSVTTTSHQPSEPIGFTEGVQKAMAAVQQPGKEKWYALVPLVMRLIDQWLSNKNANTSQPTAQQPEVPNKRKQTQSQPIHHAVVQQ